LTKSRRSGIKLTIFNVRLYAAAEWISHGE
jgi:hypothetical protein